MKRTPEQVDFDALEFAEWGAQHFTGVMPGRQHPARDFRRVEAKGHVRQEALVLCDGDGFTVQPERWRTGYVITKAGKRALAQMRRNLRTNGYPKP